MISHDINQQLLLANLEQVRQVLRNYLAAKQNDVDVAITNQAVAIDTVDHSLAAACRFNRLCERLALSTFERQILLLCLGIEICEDFATLCARIHDHPECNYPTLSLAAAVFPAEANWQALAPQAPLRHWHLIECDKTTPFSTCRLTISERVLYYLLNVDNVLDERLMPFLQPLSFTLPSAPSQEEFARRIVSYWEKFADMSQSSLPYLHVTGDIYYAQSVAWRACQQRSATSLYQIEAEMLPKNLAEWQLLQQLLVRESLLSDCVFLLHYDSADNHETLQQYQIMQLTQQLPLHCILTSNAPANWLNKSCMNLDIKPITPQEQYQLWQSVTKNTASIDNIALAELTQHFRLNPEQIAQSTLFCQGETPLTIDDLWLYCRQQSRQSLEGLAHIITPKADWQDLVLPSAQLHTLQTITQQVRHRHTVYQQWGFDKKMQRGLGLCALFAGPSGTGKTLAAEVIAKDLNIDLYHIDLSTITSKYIGETEKHIKKIFDAAEKSGALLLFDEADALFGKRTEAKDSHDRYANLGVNYLLQRIEAYQGISVLTTNFKKALDEAFLRRIRFVVNFSFPDLKQRQQIWQQVFPPETPLENLSLEKLAQLNLAGGHIHNIALNAAFLAAKMRQAVDMSHLQQAARAEYLKLEQPFPEIELCNL
jgi:hypothetical protein